MERPEKPETGSTQIPAAIHAWTIRLGFLLPGVAPCGGSGWGPTPGGRRAFAGQGTDGFFAVQGRRCFSIHQPGGASKPAWGGGGVAGRCERKRRGFIGFLFDPSPQPSPHKGEREWANHFSFQAAGQGKNLSAHPAPRPPPGVGFSLRNPHRHPGWGVRASPFLLAASCRQQPGSLGRSRHNQWGGPWDWRPRF